MQPSMIDNEFAPKHPARLGKRAVVIGAGIAGMAAAGALAGFFEQVVVLERDRLPEMPAHRPGTSQSWHAHGLLVGGLRALGALFPGIDADFASAGAVTMRINQDFREDHPTRGPMPQRDFGLSGLTMTRPIIEATLRRRASGHPNVTFRQSTPVIGIEVGSDGQRVTGVLCAAERDSSVEVIPADLVVDASGRGQPTLELLQSVGWDRLRETAIGIDLCYTTAIMAIPEDAPTDWRIALAHADAPHSGRRAVLIPVEGNRWMMTVAGRGAERPPAEWGALLAFVRDLGTRTIYSAVRRTKPIGKLARFLTPASVWRHFEGLAALPGGLVPIGDAICRFNPIYGQGMSVASKEAVLLCRLLQERATLPDPLAGLGQAFLAEAKVLIETPWSMAALPDFVYPNTRGERPADLEQSLRFSEALHRLAMRDADVQRLMVEVWHMLKPISVYQDPDLRARVAEEMAEA